MLDTSPMRISSSYITLLAVSLWMSLCFSQVSFADERHFYLNDLDLRLFGLQLELTPQFEKLLMKKLCPKSDLKTCSKKKQVQALQNRFNEKILEMSADLLKKANEVLLTEQTALSHSALVDSVRIEMEEQIKQRFTAQKILEVLDKAGPLKN